MKIKLMDAVYHPEKDLTGQIHKLRGDEALIKFVTGETITVSIKNITWVNGQWRIND
jgi:hypothetical protein